MLETPLQLVPRVVVLATLVAVGASFGAALSRGPHPTHPHGNLPLWTYTQRMRQYLGAKPGAMDGKQLEARFRAAVSRATTSAAEWKPAGAEGVYFATLRRWAERGQVDLVQHVLDADGAGSPELPGHIPSCEACRALAVDAAHGDPAGLTKIPVGKNGILLITAHEFLALDRAPLPGAAVPPKLVAAEPAFLEDRLTPRVKGGLAGMSVNVARTVGFARLDLDADGTLETEALDLNDDGVYEVLHVDRDRDGAFELEATCQANGAWKVARHGQLLDAHRRALDALAAESRPSVNAGGSRQ